MALNRDEIKAIAVEQAKYNKLMSEQAEEQRSVRDTILDQVKQLKFQKTLQKDILGATNQIYNLEYELRTEYDKQLGTQESQLSIQKDIDKTLKSHRSLQQDINFLNREGGELNVSIVENLKLQQIEAEKVLETLSKQADTSKEIRNSFGVAGFQGFAEIMKKIGGPASKLAGPFEAASEAARESVQNSVEANNVLEEKKSLLEKIASGDIKANKENLKGLNILGKEGKKIYGGSAQEAAKSALKSGKGLEKITGAPVGKMKIGMKGLGAGFKALGPIIKKALGPIGLILMVIDGIKAVIKAMFDASKQVAELQRNLYISAESARDIRKNFFELENIASNFADIQGRVLISSKLIAAEFNAMNSALGTSIDFTSELGKQFGGELLVQSAVLRDNIGLSGEAISELQKEMILTGEPVEDIYKGMAGVSAEASLAGGFMLDVNKNMEKATKIQGAMRLNFKNSNVELAKAVTTAERLGFNLSEINGAADKFLNFESSINAEMEAELLTGRELNLEGARRAALDGNTLEVAKQINAQGVKYNDLQKMNVLERKAFAEAVGMSVDGLADALKKQEEFNAIQKRAAAQGKSIADIEKKSLAEVYEDLVKTGAKSEDIKKILGAQIYETQLAEDAQKKFSKAMELVKGKFAQLFDGKMVDNLADGATKFAEFVGKFVNSVNTKGLSSTLIFGLDSSPPPASINSIPPQTQSINPSPITSSPEFSTTSLNPNQIDGNVLNKAYANNKNKSQLENGEVVVLLKEILVSTKQGGNVYLDNTKVGKTMDMNNFQMGISV